MEGRDSDKSPVLAISPTIFSSLFLPALPFPPLPLPWSICHFLHNGVERRKMGRRDEKVRGGVMGRLRQREGMERTVILPPSL